MLKKVLIVVLVLVSGVLIYASLQPNEYQVQRSITIGAKPEVIFPFLNDNRKANTWSPWLKKDPNAKVTYAGPELGANSTFSWEGNSEIGAGSSTIIQSRTNEYVQVRLDFLKPMKSTAESDYILKFDGNETQVTWSMYGHKNFMSKVICSFMSMDKMIGETFEKGLSDLKAMVEQN